MQNALNMLKKTALISIATMGFSTAAMATNTSIDDLVTVTNVSGNGVMISTPNTSNTFANSGNMTAIASHNADKLASLIGDLATQNHSTNTNFDTNNRFNMSSNNHSSMISGLITKAKNFIGLPYRFGGTSPVSGFDCSGFMQYVYKQNADVDLPRTSQAMASSGHYVSRDQLKAGDMVFFRTHGGSISHVGMYIGDNQFIHAPRTGRSIEITSLDNSYWSKTFATARRVLNDNA